MKPVHREISGARPYPFRFPPGSIALVMIDMQRDFLEPNGFGAALGNDVSKLAPAIEPARRLLDVFRRHGLPIVHTRECHRPDMSDCPSAKRARGGGSLRIGDPGPMGRILIQGEPGADIVPDLAPKRGEFVVDKPGKGAFYATDLQAILSDRAITHLVLAGVTTEVCVQTTMREANDRGYECVLAEDATESYFPEFKAAALDMIRAQGAIVGWTATVAEIADGISARRLPAAHAAD
jgi:nicotinamidase-related amidase